ncbi:hypothetical protein ED92_39325 [Amycolatopsis sp. MJM2582]|uniref:hypothetical protein n=1 Tax=Amycolatopsis sp. MJM2582 TaxID=1427749 RepID=UPI000506A49D|nr:hypothetical protein [Amycolatopsis sp. MJM2582]KFZ77128.1 hypothetical protein ED92_39325 [Amycolatopsis sp. MJM2582]
MITLARDIAQHLEGNWKAGKGLHDNGTDAYLHGPNGERLQIRPGTTTPTRNRVEIYGPLPYQFTRHNEPRHLITVSPDKTAARIAADITRRLLPAYREGMLHATEAKVRHELREAEKSHTITTLLGILPKTHHFTHGQDSMDFGGGRYSMPIGGQLRVLSNSQVEWTIHTTKELAFSLAETIYALSRGGDIPQVSDKSTAEPG